ncbi:DUF6508 domain-containing protein [Methylobacterium sp. WL64]|uniref:DUF6508 domain-containing protein n=1 Tax=Methylobacterium sp. WL64 TaxID=2603894 RepID=UPI00164FFA31|nr:DUF6508 domain-containing protein [Methylobacterium sp. WL64]
MVEAKTTRAVRLAALARYFTAFADPAAPVGLCSPQAAPADNFSPATFLPNDEVQRFVADCYTHGWVLDGFDWAAWAQTPKAQRLRDDPTALARASERQLARLLTTVIRQDRFVEGALAAAFASGLISGILRRAGALSEAASQGDE